MKSWLKENEIKIYLTYNKVKSVTPEQFSRNLKNNIHTYMTVVSKAV